MKEQKEVHVLRVIILGQNPAHFNIVWDVFFFFSPISLFL